MRTLKRTLALVLALVMVLGMGAFASAVEFNDAAEIKYAEAVGVLSAIGVLNGKPLADGTYDFDPQGTLTRAEAAKIVTFLLKEEDVKATANFTDTVGHWAEGPIAYIASKGIVEGYNGEFNPEGTLTGAAFGKMLLGVLGYNAKVEEMTGDAWEVNVGSLLKKTGLTTGIVGFDGTADITREAAAQMALNTLKATMVEYKVAGTSITVGGVEIVTGGSDATDRTDVVKVSGTEVDYTGTADAKLQFCEEYFPELSLQTGTGYDADAYGRPGYSWVVTDTDPATDDVEVFVGKAPIFTYTAPTKEEVIAKATAKYTFDGITDAAEIADATAYGTVVEVYGNALTKTLEELVVIEEKLGKVTKVTPAKDEAKRTVTVAGMTFETESFAKDDVVVYTTNEAGTAIVTMAAAQTFVGKIESYNGTYKTVTIGGKTYNYGHDFSLTANFTKDYTFTQFSDGSIAAQAEVKAAAAAVSKDYVYVVKTEYQQADNSSLVTSTAAAAKAQVIFADGTAGVIDLNMYKNTSKVVSVKAPAANGTVTETAFASVGAGATIGTWFAYKANEDGTYTLSAIDAKYAAVVGDTTLVKDTMKVIAGKSTTKDTAITYVDTTAPAAVVSNLTGFVALTLEGSGNEILVTYAGPTATTIAAIYAVKQAPIVVADTADYAYAVKAGNVVADGTEWTFAIKGEQKTYIIAAGETVAAGNVYTLTENTADTTKDNYLVSEAVSMTGNALVTVIDGNQVATSDGAVLTLSDKVAVYNVDETATVAGEVKTLAVGDVIDYIVVSGKVTNIWVYAVDATVEVKTAAALQAAVANEPAGITILMAEGTYALASRLSLTKDVTIVADGAVTVSGSDSDSIFNLNTAGVDVVINGVKFVSTGGNGHYGILVDSLADGSLKVVDCYFTTDSADNGNGVNISGYPKVTIETCTFDNVKRGVCVDAPNVWDNITVKGCIFTGVEYAGVRTVSRAFGATVNKTAEALVEALLAADNAGLTEALIKID